MMMMMMMIPSRRSTEFLQKKYETVECGVHTDKRICPHVKQQEVSIILRRF